MSDTKTWLESVSKAIRELPQGQSFKIRGQGSKSFYGMPEHDGPVLSTLDYSGVIDYDPTELVVVAKSGTPISELEALLAQSRQMLAFEPPRFDGKGTVGGMVASGLSGPARISAGAIKDFMLGMTILDSQGAALRFGGTVMKNVAGYDMPRLYTGSLGTLGLIVDVSIKVMPMPVASQTLVFEVSAQESIDRVNQWGGQPLPISATCWHQGRLWVRLAGAHAAIKSAMQKMGGDPLQEKQAASFWQSVRDQAHDFFSLGLHDQQVQVWRISVPTVSAHLGMLSGETLIEWGGGLRWVKSSEPPALIRAQARAAGGHAVLYRTHNMALKREIGTFAELPPALMKIHHRLKQELDPRRIFNPGRMIPGI